MRKETETINETKEDITFDVRTSAVFYEQWYQIIKGLPPKERDTAYKYIFEYAFYGIEPELPKRDKKGDKTSMAYVVFGMAKPNIDSAQKRYDFAVNNGSKGGRPKKVTEEVLEKIETFRKNGMTQKQVASELGLSLKTIQRVERDKSQNHNVNVNVNDNVNVNVNNVASDDDDIMTASPTTQTHELTWEEYNNVMDIWELSKGTGKRPNDIAKELNLDVRFVCKAIDEYKKNGFTRKEKPKPEQIRIIGHNDELTDYYTCDFSIDKDDLTDKYKEFTNPFGFYKFKKEFVEKWFKEEYGYAHA